MIRKSENRLSEKIMLNQTLAEAMPAHSAP
jgi:hypothetical protein